ncbi:hypothetical protein AU197_11850 [Mycobacterium sp. IS-1590]|uniref:hypothetical protein n=1 Tax=Mycobacterium sp. IS-1590 TaxID=1772286 RepID=UPI0007492EF6|nr:hypothetical protein [Mycobacterium sp. IS-1590]KUI44957.1 hypothetical protein AU197_11850 [Mycobacterium sp. IS-1590]
MTEALVEGPRRVVDATLFTPPLADAYRDGPRGRRGLTTARSPEPAVDRLTRGVDTAIGVP